MNWFDNAVFYHIYPLGYCGCPKDNDFKPKAGESPILRVIKHIPVIKQLGFNAIYFGPVFESTRHGYDTADYLKIDSRLGTNEDFAK
ncbi:MAG: alpha-amylase family glycosyl hydrolase, partial [Oscillospiraceae bacterium]|nr:alpha-amylase family glycosyl hydrolase [Oscillospiraceae bacterium]